MEAQCTFVSSRGILHSCNIHSYCPQSSCETDTKYLDDWFITMTECTASAAETLAAVYVCSELLSYFVKRLHLIKKPYVLVSGDSDLTPSDYEYEQLVAHPLLIKWFAQNLLPSMHPYHPKVHLLPIGLDYHTLSNILPSCSTLPHPWGQRNTPMEQEKILMQIKATATTLSARKQLIYSNVQYKLDRWGDRKKALTTIPHSLLVMAPQGLTREHTWRNMIKYQFVLSPFGNGRDCHRTWEALILGCIPICCVTNKAAQFTDLPILYVNKWEDVTPMLLKKAAIKYYLMAWNWDKLLLKYWMESIYGPNKSI